MDETKLFQFQDKIHYLSEGTSMGNPLSPWMAEIFMGHLEQDLCCQNLLPKGWVRYVDDIWAIVKKSEVANVLSILNSLYPTIKFTVEEESEGVLNFLDIQLTRSRNNFDVNVYRKPTCTDRFISVDSFCPMQHKLAAFNSMVFRLEMLPLSLENYNGELLKIKKIANANGFHESHINKLVVKHKQKFLRNSQSTFYRNATQQTTKRVKMVYFPAVTNKLENIFNKHKLKFAYNSTTKIKNYLKSGKIENKDEFSKSGIYKIDCSSCEFVYIGQCCRKISTRFAEHISHLKHNELEKSAVANHIFNTSHTITRDNLQLLKEVNDKRQLDAYESLFMYKYKNHLMNTKSAPISSNLFEFAHS